MRAVFLDRGTLGPPGDLDLSPLTRSLPDLVCHDATPPGLVGERVAGAEVVLVNKVRLDADTLARSGAALQLICLAATGTDNVDLEAARRRGIGVCNIRDYCTPSVAQHVFGLLLALTTRVADYQRRVREGAWSRGPHFCLLDFPVRELCGLTLGIIGLGTLGTAVARLGLAFGMRVVAARRPYDLDAPLRGAERTPVPGISRDDFGTVLAAADVVSLHCPLTPDTVNLIGERALARMRTDAVLINTARGGLVDTAALVTALRAGGIGGAGLDVLPVEPPPADDPALATPPDNLVVTPHVAWAAREARQRAVDAIGENVAAFQRGERLNRVD